MAYFGVAVTSFSFKSDLSWTVNRLTLDDMSI